MKAKTVGVLLILMCAVSAKAQNAKQNALTAAQCHSDQAQWLAELTLPNKSGTQSVLAGALLSRIYEMNQCVSIDEASATKYLDVERMALAIVTDRMNDFIHRHGLTEQFFDEDVAGKR